VPTDEGRTRNTTCLIALMAKVDGGTFLRGVYGILEKDKQHITLLLKDQEYVTQS
jgi:hypothetical protein